MLPAPKKLRGVLVLGITCVAAATCADARAQAPSCAWAGGVTLPVGDQHGLLIADDGAAGVVAVTWRVPGTGADRSLRFFHVLEQGRLDPSLPATGVPFISASDLTGDPELWALRVVADGVGGAYVLVAVCSQIFGGYDCSSPMRIRLMHVTAGGAGAPGWPALGIGLGSVLAFQEPLDQVDICTDRSSGVILAWIDQADSTIRAQRFAPGGSTLRAGGLNGLVVLNTQAYRPLMRLGGDHAGGCSVVTSQGVNQVGALLQLRAGRVDASGSLPWTSSGRAVITQPSYSSIVQSVSVDDQGRTLVAILLQQTLVEYTYYAYSQLLTPQGVRLWSQFGSAVGPQGSYGWPMTCLVASSGYLTVHHDAATSNRFQLQDEFGSKSWEPDSNGTVAAWAQPQSSQQLPLAAPDGDVLSVWWNRDGDRSIRAIELDGSGAVAAGWPANGALVCGTKPSSSLADAMISHGQLFVALGAECCGENPIVQRLSRAVLSVDADRVRTIELSPPAPNPARGSWAIHLALPAESNVMLEAFDVAGRRLLAADLGRLAAGRHALAVPGSDAMTPGGYRIRVRAGALVAERVLVKLR